MTKENQSNRLDSIDFVQDISSETAAVYSGGFLGDLKQVILYEDGGLRGKSTTVTLPDSQGQNVVGAFNDKTSSIQVVSGRWRFYEDADNGGRRTVVLGPGSYSQLPASFNDEISSVRRVD